MNKKIIYIGSDDFHILPEFKKLYPEHNVFIMDKDIFNKTTEELMKKHIKWKEDQSISSFIQKPENIEIALQKLSDVKTLVGTDWFTLKQLALAGGISYKQGKELMELLFCFGYIAMDDATETTKYIVVDSLQRKMIYIQGVINDKQAEVDHLKEIVVKMEKDLPTSELEAGNIQEFKEGDAITEEMVEIKVKVNSGTMEILE